MVSRTLTNARATDLLHGWFATDVPDGRWNDDRMVLDWMSRFESAIRGRVTAVAKENVVQNVVKEVEKEKTAAAEAIVALAKTMDSKSRDELINQLKEM